MTIEEITNNNLMIVLHYKVKALDREQKQIEFEQIPNGIPLTSAKVSQ